MKNYILLTLENLNFSSCIKYAFHPIRGKPSILWVIQSLSLTKEDIVVIIIDKKNQLLENVLRSYAKRNLNIHILKITPSKNNSILTALRSGLKICKKDLETIILSGDSVVLDENIRDPDIIYVSQNLENTNTRSLIKKNSDNFLEECFYPSLGLEDMEKEITVGRYSFKDTFLLTKSLENAICENKKDFNSLLINYQKKRPLITRNVNKWFDFSYISSIIKFSYNFFNIRSFNEITVHENNIIEKSSKNKLKLKNEESWYKSLPLELHGFSPRIINSYEKEDRYHLWLEMYGYPTLSEMYVYDKRKTYDWCYIIEKLISCYGLFQNFKIAHIKEVLIELYKNKTVSRIEELKKDKIFGDLLKADAPIVINGINYHNYNYLHEKIENKLEDLIENYNQDFSIVHGDLCFSNILFDSMNYSFKFIDPRGEIYGDARYDMAKLRHSIVGLYDFIVLGEYYLKKIDSYNFEMDIFAHKNKGKLGKHFDKHLEQNGFNVKEIAFIEALLFLTMIPLHTDDQSRQQCFYLTAIKKFNEIFYENP